MVAFFAILPSTISTTTGSIRGGIEKDFYNNIGGIDQLCYPVT